MKILVTGGAGYVGSHICLELLTAGHQIAVVDNLYNGHLEAINRVKKLSDRNFEFGRCDVRDRQQLKKIFNDFKPDAVIHCAGLKSVSESYSDPARYYDVNVSGTAVLLKVMEEADCDKIVFSSSATVYGIPVYLPCDEKHPLQPQNPYGRSKLMCEQIIKDWAAVDICRKAVALRYFNPVGADTSSIIGEDPKGNPNNLMPILAQVAIGRRECLQVFGADYETVDGTGVRDYIHVTDLAGAHIVAVEKLCFLKNFEVINVGTGRGVSVMELVREFERQSGKVVTLEFSPRRTGDAPAVWADANYASQKLGFNAELGIAEMCRDTWRFQRRHPLGY